MLGTHPDIHARWHRTSGIGSVQLAGSQLAGWRADGNVQGTYLLPPPLVPLYPCTRSHLLHPFTLRYTPLSCPFPSFCRRGRAFPRLQAFPGSPESFALAASCAGRLLAQWLSQVDRCRAFDRPLDWTPPGIPLTTADHLLGIYPPVTSPLFWPAHPRRSWSSKISTTLSSFHFNPAVRDS